MDIFNDYSWHSCLEPTRKTANNRIIRKISANSPAMSKFMKLSSDGRFLVHKSKKALWVMSDDNKCITPVFQDDILTEQDFEEEV